MSAVWTTVIGWCVSIFGTLAGHFTPVIKTELNDFMTNLYKKALATPNPWDDFAVGLLLDILAIPRPPPDTPAKA